MPTKPIDRLLFEQGGQCFFCQQPLLAPNASVEHLLAKADGGTGSEGNTVACCKALNSLLGRKSLKEKLRVVLNQRGAFTCPNDNAESGVVADLPDGAFKRVKTDLLKRGKSCPGTVKALKRTMNNLFDNKLTEQQLALLLNELQSAGLVTVSGTKLTYVSDVGPPR